MHSFNYLKTCINNEYTLLIWRSIGMRKYLKTFQSLLSVAWTQNQYLPHLGERSIPTPIVISKEA